MSSLLRAWYLFLALGLLTFVFTALVGRPPAELGAAVALPHNLLYRAGVNLRSTAVALADRSDLRAQVERLRDRNAGLEQQVRDLTLQVERLSEVVRVSQDQSPGVVTTAPVIGMSSGEVLERLTLGRGRRHGLLDGMPVTVPEGLVGIVTDVTPGNAVVRAVTDPQSRVGVSVRGRGGWGIAVGEIGGLIRVVDYVEADPVEVGDIVETSSYGGLFPRGVLVGEVVDVLPRDPNELRRTFVVRPAVDLSTLLEVALIAPQ